MSNSLKKELIISLAKQFGFTEAVKIHYDLPYEGEAKFDCVLLLHNQETIYPIEIVICSEQNYLKS